MFSAYLLRRTLLGSLCLAATAGIAQSTDESYEVAIWSTVVFDTSGKSSDVQIVDEETHPEKFVTHVRTRLRGARIQPPLDGGGPATLKTGVEMVFLVTPSHNGGTVKVLGLTMQPLPLKTYFASYPTDIARTGGWKGAVTAVCTVGIEGRCVNIDVQALPGMPESVRRYAKASLESWTFSPQEVNGKPVEGEYKLFLSFETLDSMPENFRGSKFERAARSK